MNPRRFGIAAFSVAAVIGVAALIGQATGLRLNLTESAPLGIWRVQPFDTVIKRGALVEICPPALPIIQLMADRGYLAPGSCPSSGITPLLKPVSAVAGDKVVLQKGKPVLVNGTPLLNTTSMLAIPAWPAGEYIVQPGEI